MSAYYDEFENKYYNPDDDAKKPGDNENWKMIQKGFKLIGSTQLETSEGLTLGKGKTNEESLTASELEELKNPSQLETSGGLTLGKGTADEESLTALELEEIKSNVGNIFSGLVVLSNVSVDTSPSIQVLDNVDITVDSTVSLSESDTVKCISASGFGSPTGNAIAIPAFPFSLTYVDAHTVRAAKLVLLTFGTSSGPVGGAMSFVLTKSN